MKIKVGVFFGGKSVEHEISIISAVQAMLSLDTEKYDVIPVYMTKDNKFYTGEQLKNIENYKDIKALLEKSQRIVLQNIDGKVRLLSYPFKKFGKNEINYIDNQINTLYGRAFRNGGNVDESQVNKLENEMNTYKKKIELLEPIYEVLKEI